MIELRRVFRVYIPLLLFSAIAAGPALSQPPGGGADQTQMAQNNQTGQQGAPTGGQMQQGPGGQQGFGQMSGQGQGGQMQTVITQALKQKLGCTDDEWTVIGPKVLKVFTLISSQTSGFQMRALMGNTRQGNAQGRQGSNTQSSSSGDKTLEELQTLLASEDTTSTQLKSKIAEVRKANEKSRQELAKAQKDLRELLSLKQEAILISLGMLE